MAQEIENAFLNADASAEDGVADRKQNWSSLQLAFFGDAVYELAVREYVLKHVSGHVDKLNKHSKRLSMAVTQSQIADHLSAEEFLSAEELSVYKRGRNAKAANLPKSCTPSQYRRATGLEALIGWLFLNGKKDRAEELIAEGIAYVSAASGQNPSEQEDARSECED